MTGSTRALVIGVLLAAWLALGWHGTVAGSQVVDGIWAKAKQQKTKASPYAGEGDAALYRKIVERVSAGEPYYAAATAEQRTRGYPTKPVFAIRLPTLATLFAWLGEGGIRLAAALAMVAAIAAWSLRLYREFPGRPIWVGIALLIGLGSLGLTSTAPLYFHEAWAGILIALSLGLWAPGKYRASVAIALAAVLIRELALAYILGMAFFALLDRRWKEVAWWLGAVGVFGIAMIAHASAAAPHVLPGDLQSQGWMAMSGWGFSLAGLNMTTALTALPMAVTAFLLPLSIAGWAGWRHPLALRAAVIIAGYLISFTIIGRTDNFYWGLMTAPLILAGLMFLPQAVARLFAR